MKTKLIATVLAVVLLVCCGGCTPAATDGDEVSPDSVDIVLSDSEITVDGEKAGTEGAVFLSNDIIYYENKESYDSGNPYGEGEEHERHTAEDAAAATVVNITEPGTYRLSGTLSEGQIRVDLGEDAFTDPEAVVTLVLDGTDISCSVAPAILFLNVYECDNEWTSETATSDIDTTAAGANLIIADGTENNISGSHVAKIFEDNTDEKKLWKQDGAIYSYMSMNVDGIANDTGVLNLTADNEGLDTELHLTINGGSINIRSDNDGINTNEDGVSVTTINGGNLHIMAGLGAEGDGVDSNGWLVINGGTVIASANPAADAGLDSDMGSYVNGGTVVALGSTMDWAESDSDQVTMNMQFSEFKHSGDAIVITAEDGETVFAYDPSEDEVLGENARQYMGAVVSCPAFTVGDTYNVYIGGTVTGTEVSGVYDAVTVTGYTGGTMQAYTGTDVMIRPGGMRPGGFQEGERPDMSQLPKDFDPGAFDGEPPEIPEGGFGVGEAPEIPEGGFSGAETPQPDGGMGRGERPQMPEGETPESGMAEGEAPILPEGWTDTDREAGTMELTTAFYMQDKVNFFSGLQSV